MTDRDLRAQLELEWVRLATAVRVHFPFRAADYPKGPSARREAYITRRLAELRAPSFWAAP